MKRTTTTRMALGVVAGLIALTACGSDGDDAADTTDAPAETVAEAPVETDAAAGEIESFGTVVDVAVLNGSFDTLVAAVTAADLGETLSGEGPFTVFAPTDDAFAALPDGLLEALLLPENKAVLAQILTYHVVPGAVMAADITDGDVATVEGQTVALSTADGVTVNGATVLIADVPADNGVIHAIDAVLLPPGVDAAALIG
jgi:uncharacterized surface protein with fasciclin (FAS1) repeats